MKKVNGGVVLGRLDFLKLYSSVATVRVRRAALKIFFEAVLGKTERKGENGKPVEIPLEELAEMYFREDRDHERNVQDLLVALKASPPMTVRTYLSSVKVFLLENDVELPAKFWRRIQGRIRGSRALTLDRVPNNMELRKIVMHLPIHGRALYLLLASSGMRIGEALQLKLEDVEFDVDPARISIRGGYTKTGNPRIAFVSREAREAVLEWLKVRDQYLETAVAKSHKYVKNTDDPRVFPFESTTARLIWTNAVDKNAAERDEEELKKKTRSKGTGRYKLHPHVLRKFFRTRMGSVIPVDVVEALMGHEGYLTEVYRRYSIEDLAKFYKDGEHAVLVFAEAAEVSRLRQEIEERNRQLQTIVNGLTAENLELKGRLRRVEEEITKVQLALEEMINKPPET